MAAKLSLSRTTPQTVGGTRPRLHCLLPFPNLHGLTL